MLESNNWNRNTTADQLGINRTTLYKKMKRLGLEDGHPCRPDQSHKDAATDWSLSDLSKSRPIDISHESAITRTKSNDVMMP